MRRRRKKISVALAIGALTIVVASAAGLLGPGSRDWIASLSWADSARSYESEITDDIRALAGGSFGCLAQSARTIPVARALISGDTQLGDGTLVPDSELWFGRTHYTRTIDDTGIDLRNATVITPVLNPLKENHEWYPLQVRGDLDHICIAGGDFIGKLPLDIGWHDSKGSFEGAIGDNSAAVTWSSPNSTVSGIFATNNHDGVRPASRDGGGADNWTVTHSWLEYIRDDCIEAEPSDGDGRVFDSLFDGCYVGVSVRESGDCPDCDRTGDTITLDSVLMRIEPMPFPYKWDSRHEEYHLYIEPYTTPVSDRQGIESADGIPFGGGHLFKVNSNYDANPRFAINDSIFLFQQWVRPLSYRFPPDMVACENNTIVWAGNESLEEFLAVFEAPEICDGEISVTDDLSVWTDAVADWHQRHPDVGKDHKPEIMGDIRIPRWDRQPWRY